MLQRLFRAQEIVTGQLKNGMKVFCSHHEGLTSAVGVFIKAGSRQETSRNNGVSHFLEHLYFKGTENVSQEELEDRFELLGSLMNAHTSREYTCYTSHGLSDHAELSLESIADMLLVPLLSRRSIKLERSTVLREYEEVNMIIEEFLYDQLHELVYPDHPLGFTILGPLDNIEQLSKRDFDAFRKQFYTAHNMILVGAGNVTIEELEHIGNKYFDGLPTHDSHLQWEESPPVFQGGLREVIPLEDNTFLTTGFGYEGPGYDDYHGLIKVNLMQVLAGFYDVFETTNYHTDLTRNLLEFDDSCRLIVPWCMAYGDRSLFGLEIGSDGGPGSADLVDVAVDLFGKIDVSEGPLELARSFLLNQMFFGRQEDMQLVLEEVGRMALFIDEKYWDLETTAELIQSTTTADMEEFLDSYVSSVQPSALQVGNAAYL